MLQKLHAVIVRIKEHPTWWEYLLVLGTLSLAARGFWCLVDH